MSKNTEVKQKMVWAREEKRSYMVLYVLQKASHRQLQEDV